MRSLILIFVLSSCCFLKAQPFYEKIMEMNISNADTSNDVTILKTSANAIDRVSKGTSNNWEAAYHIALCYVRMTDLFLIKKDSIRARNVFGIAKENLMRADTLRKNNIENKTLIFYHRINELRLTKPDPKTIKILEAQLEVFKKANVANPRFHVVNAYFYRCFYQGNKAKQKKELELLQGADKLFEMERPMEFNPRWGKKWMNELSNELNSKPIPAKGK